MRVLLVVVVIFWVAITASRVWVWQDESRLWAEAVRVSPEKPRPWANLGRQFGLRGDVPAAEDAFHQALILSERRPEMERRWIQAVVHENLVRLHLDLDAWIRTP